MNNNRNNRRRGRNNNRGQSGGNQANRIDSRARGNAPQLLDKYKKLAQDAQHNGDRVQMEYYLQFADHYFRVVADNKARQEEARAKRQEGRGGHSDNEKDGARDSERGKDGAKSGDDSKPSKPRKSHRDNADDAGRVSGAKTRKSSRSDDGDSVDDTPRGKAKDGRATAKRSSRKANGSTPDVSNHLPPDNEPAPYPPQDSIAIDEDVLPPPINIETDDAAAKKAAKPRKAAASGAKASSADDKPGLSAAG